MKFTITPIEARILGCLIEKEATTPDVYPLTLNSLLTACNQKSNREPVMHLDNDELLSALDSLTDHTLVSTWKSERNRMAKYKHALHQRISEEFDFSLPELAVLGVLFLRGPQTTGEIRSRCARIHEFDSLGAVQDVLAALEGNPNGPYVTMLPRQAGRKESRYAHLFCGPPDEATAPAGNTAKIPTGSLAGLEELQLEVSQLRSELHELELRFEQFKQQFE